MTTTAEVLRAHQLQAACLETGETVWRCPTCKVDYAAAEARHGAAEAQHQAAALGCIDGWPETEPEIDPITFTIEGHDPFAGPILHLYADLAAEAGNFDLANDLEEIRTELAAKHDRKEFS